MTSGDITGGLLDISKTLGGMRAGILGVVAALGAMKLLQFIQQSGEVAKNNETMAVVLEQVGKNAGYTAEQVDYALASVKKMGITTSAASHSLVQMAQSEISWTTASKLARIAQDAAVIGMTNSSDAFSRLIYGIKTGQTEILRNIGIQVNFQQSYNKMAQTLHKSVTSLSEQEKAQARANATIEAGAAIAGTYEAAMGTAGKMQSSMARLIEETQNNLGQLLLPLETASIKMQYEFWQGTQQATEGLKEWGIAIDAIMISLGTLGQAAEKSKGLTFGEKIGKGLHEAARTLIQFHIGAVAMLEALGAGIDIVLAKIDQFIYGFSDMAKLGLEANKAMLTGQWGEAVKIVREMTDPEKMAEKTRARAEIAGKDIGETMGSAWTDSLIEQISAIEKEHPDWLAEYGEAASKVDLAAQVSDAEKLAGEYDKQVKLLQKQAQIVNSVNQIYKNYSKQVESLGKQHEKDLANLDKQLGKQRTTLEEKTVKALQNLDKDSAKSRSKIISDSQKNIIQSIKQANKEMERERKRFELEQMQSLRRFKNQEKWLMAEGDVLGLMQARENFDLQRKEAAENFDLQKGEQKQSNDDQIQQQKEQLQERLQELDADIQERRIGILESYQEELDDLIQNNAEQRANMEAAYAERLDDLRNARDAQLQELAKSLNEEKDLTEQGMQALAETIAKVFGDQGAADALMKGWNDRTKNGFEATFAEMEARIKYLQGRIDVLRSGGSAATTTDQGYQDYMKHYVKAQGMRQGGVGVVTGPALFEVEPGVKEAFAFMPMNRGGGSKSILDVNVGGGINIGGAQNASPGVVDAAVQTVMQEIAVAVKRLRKI